MFGSNVSNVLTKPCGIASFFLSSIHSTLTLKNRLTWGITGSSLDIVLVVSACELVLFKKSVQGASSTIWNLQVGSYKWSVLSRRREGAVVPLNWTAESVCTDGVLWHLEEGSDLKTKLYIATLDSNEAGEEYLARIKFSEINSILL